MESMSRAFQQLLNNHDRSGAVEWALDQLMQKTLSIPQLYEDILAVSLTRIGGPDTPQEVAIWEEHVHTGIVMAVMGACLPILVQQRPVAAKRLSVMVFCPEDEYHSVGAQMAVDFFALCGYDAVFIGANTPRDEVLAAAKVLNPHAVAISVSNYYHLRPGLRTAQLVREHMQATKVLFGGLGAIRNAGVVTEAGFRLLRGYEDIAAMAKEDGLL